MVSWVDSIISISDIKKLNNRVCYLKFDEIKKLFPIIYINF